MKYLPTGLLFVIALGVIVLAFNVIYGLLTTVPSGTTEVTNYGDLVVILLTTVTVIFTVSALVIGILALLGPRAIRREAGKFAEKAVLRSIDDALKSDGKATKLLESRFPPNDGPIKDWMEERIERQVISLLPLIIDRIGVRSDVGPIDPEASDDEGDVD